MTDDQALALAMTRPISYENIAMLGVTFGTRTVLALRFVEHCKRIRLYARVQCSCGKSALTDPSALRSGKNTRCHSCGATAHLTTHGQSKTSLYKIWNNMKQRCTNPSGPRWSKYGGRGITVCERWASSFENFAADMGPRPSPAHSIDRINNNGNYEPGNVRWATTAEQNRNTSRNIKVTINGKTRVMKDAAIDAGISPVTLRDRVRSGVRIDRALQTKPRYDDRAGTQRFDIHGDKLTVKEIAQRYGMSVNTLKSRMQRGWKIERAIEANDHRRAA
jgi:hypothetical protein